MEENSKQVSQEKPVEFGFDTTDGGRKQGDWKTRYTDPIAQKAIIWERNYIITLLILCVIIILTIGIVTNNCLFYFPCKFLNLKNYAFAWLGGTLGGIIFSMKWLCHTVAKNIWNIDRRLWRIFIPHLSGALALIMIVLINGGLLNYTGTHNISFHKTFGIGFLVGYFSDNAIGKLTELANVFFANKK